jgi:PilZ domain
MIEEPSNQLYQFLRAKYRAVGEAHRTNPRRHTSRPARLSWTEGEKCRVVRARLQDISRAGVALTAIAPPPVNTKARIRLVGREPTPWIEATILGVEVDAEGWHKVRLQFVEPCPTYFLRVAVLPQGSERPSRLPISEPSDEVVREPVF